MNSNNQIWPPDRGRLRSVRPTNIVKRIIRKTATLIKQHRLWAIAIGVGLLLLAVALVYFAGRDRTVSQPTNPVIATYQKQLPDLKKKVESSPKDPIAHTNYAIALYVTQDLNGAKKQYEAAIELKDNDTLTYNNLGNVYRDLGQTDKAITAYQKSLDLNPKSVNTYANLANIQLYTKNKPADAIATYKKALTQLPGNAQIEILLAIAYEQAGDKTQAKKTYETILARDSTNTAAQANLDRLKK